jgi:hypothetical protein
MQCANCQSELSPDERFCGECGHPVAVKPSQPSATATPTAPPPVVASAGTGLAKWIVGGVVVVCVVGMVLSAMFFFRSGEQPAQPPLSQEKVAAATQPQKPVAFPKEELPTSSSTATTSSAEAGGKPAEQGEVSSPGVVTRSGEELPQGVKEALEKLIQSRSIAGAKSQGLTTEEITTSMGEKMVITMRPETGLSEGVIEIPDHPPEDVSQSAKGHVPEQHAGQAPLGWYEVVTATPLLSEPAADAEIVTHLQSRTRVKVTGAVGDYLEVRSTKGGRNGYVLRDDVVLGHRE